MPAWDVYLCAIDGVSCVVGLDMELADAAPQAQRPQCLWASILLRQQDPDGWGTNAETEVLYRVEARIAAAMETLGAVYAGRIRGGGRWELCFYAPATAGFEEAVERAMAAFPAYDWRCEDEPDPDWDFYFNVLWPDPISVQQIRNAATIRALNEDENSLGRPRPVHHRLRFPDPAARQAFLADAAGDYEPREGATDPDGQCWAHLSATHAVDPHTIDNRVIALCEAAERHGGHYDGWRCL